MLANHILQLNFALESLVCLCKRRLRVEMNQPIGKGLTDYEAQMNVDMRRGFVSMLNVSPSRLEKVLATVFFQLLLTTGIVYAIWYVI